MKTTINTLQRAENYNETLEALKEMKCTFDIVHTSTSQYLKIGKERIYKVRSGEDIPPRELYIFKMVQDDATAFLGKNPQHKGAEYRVNTVFANIDIKATTNYINDNVTEIDLTAAYTEQALRLGIITKNTYDKLKKASKPTRLAAIGSIATENRTEKYKDGQRLPDDMQPEPTTKETAPLFFFIALQVQNIMLEIVNRYPQTFFCWVDAAFIPYDIERGVKELLGQMGVTYKIKRNLVLQLTRRRDTLVNCTVTQLDLVTGELVGEGRDFNFSLCNSLQVINAIAAREREMLGMIKGLTGEQVKALLMPTIVKTYKTTKIKDINIPLILGALNDVGLDYRVMLDIDKYFIVECTEYDYQTQNIIKYALAGDIIDNIKDVKNAIDQREFLASEVQTDKEGNMRETIFEITHAHHLRI